MIGWIEEIKNVGRQAHHACTRVNHHFQRRDGSGGGDRGGSLISLTMLHCKKRVDDEVMNKGRRETEIGASA